MDELRLAREIVRAATRDGWSYDTDPSWPEKKYKHTLLVMNVKPNAEMRLKEVTMFDEAQKPVAIAAYVEDAKSSTITALAYDTLRGLSVVIGALVLMTKSTRFCVHQTRKNSHLELLLQMLGFQRIYTPKHEEEVKGLKINRRWATNHWCREPTYLT